MKRSSGEGNIRKRSDGRWEASVMHESRRRYVYGQTRREVVEKLAELKKQQEQGADFSRKNLTVETYLNQWLADVVTPNLRPRTAERYKELTNKYLIPQLGLHKIRELNPMHVQKFINALPKTIKPLTVRNIRAVLRRALNNAIAWRLVEYNAAQVVTLPKAEKQRTGSLELEQVQKFLAVVKGHRLEALYLIAVVLGLRQGEILGLRREDVDLDKLELRIDSQVLWEGGKLKRVPTKTDASKRSVYIPDLLIEPLRRVLEEPANGSLLFPSEVGTPISPRNLVRQFKALLKKAGLPDTIRFHDLRHTAASFALANGMDIKTTQDMLGHAQASTTLDIYGHVLKENKRVVVNDVVNRAFGNVVTEDKPQQEAA